MIVRQDDAGVRLITQPDHAQLAGRIMTHCAALRGHPRRASILRAVAEHDIGWVDVDAAPVVHRDSGRVADFITLADEVRQEIWPRAVALLADDAYAAALVAQHALTAYGRYSTEPGWSKFFRTMEQLRDAQLRASGLSRADLDADYPFVRLGDVISLAFCTGSDALQVEPWTVAVSDHRVVVTPDPFAGVVVPAEIRARQLRDRPFASDDELRAAVASAEWVTLDGEIAGPR